MTLSTSVRTKNSDGNVQERMGLNIRAKNNIQLGIRSLALDVGDEWEGGSQTIGF